MVLWARTPGSSCSQTVLDRILRVSATLTVVVPSWSWVANFAAEPSTEHHPAVIIATEEPAPAPITLAIVLVAVAIRIFASSI